MPSRHSLLVLCWRVAPVSALGLIQRKNGVFRVHPGHEMRLFGYTHAHKMHKKKPRVPLKEGRGLHMGNRGRSPLEVPVV